jgi:16S rRNA (cytidine1402-2'-O)-methyltransferase
LYLVSTPIGNLGDISERALQTMRNADFIAAEDTRVSLKLLNRFEIKKPLVSYYEHNRHSSGERILERLMNGESCALVTDAGTPAISDPGEDIVRLCAARGIDVIAVPGACAAVAALSVSALPTGRFCFEGFLSTSKKSRGEHLENLKTERRTMIFYEAPHKLLATLADMLETFGDRSACLCRELTKLHEEVYRGTLSAALAYFTEKPPRGEFVLVIDGAPEITEPEMSASEALELMRGYVRDGLSRRDAAKKAALESGRSKNALYELSLAADSGDRL